MSPAQCKYCTTKKELLAVLHFCRQYHHYLLGRPFIVQTDHSSLTWLLTFKHPEGTLARWLKELCQFDMTIQHRAGRKHCNADALSRIPTLDSCNCYEAGLTLESLPCYPCKHCEHLQQQWQRFEDDVDDVIPLAIQSVQVNESDDPGELISEDVSWLEQYSQELIQKMQTEDSDLCKL